MNSTDATVLLTPGEDGSGSATGEVSGARVGDEEEEDRHREDDGDKKTVGTAVFSSSEIASNGEGLITWLELSRRGRDGGEKGSLVKMEERALSRI